MNPARALVLLQARTGSTRLPGKVLADIAGTPLMERCIRRLQAACVGPVMVATTALVEDRPIVELADRCGALVVQGSVEDVLGRFVQGARHWDGRFVIRATADNPLVDIEACGRVLQYLARGADYVVEKGLPVGAAVEGMTTAALREAGRVATDPYDREHVTPWLRRATEAFTVGEPWAPADLVRWDLRFTVDTAADLQYIHSVVDGAGHDPVLPLGTYIAAADRLGPRADIRAPEVM